MRKIRSKHTSPELIVRQLVYGLGYRYRLHVSSLPGKPDLVFSRLTKIIDVKGCFWHQHSGCIDSHVPKSRTEYWEPKLTRNVERDRKNQRKLRSMGWDVLTIWDCELKDSATCVKKIKAFLLSVPNGRESLV